MQDGYVTPAAKIAQGTVPDGASISVLGPYDYRLPIPATPPVAAEVPDLDVTVTGAFLAAEGEPIVAGTKVRWIAALTNTGTVDLHDVGVADGRKLAELPIGATGAVVFETTMSERDLIDHSISVDARAGAVTPAAVDYSEQVLGALAVPAVAPAPVDPVGPAAAPAGPDSRPAAAPVAGAAARQVTEATTSTGTAASTGSSGSTRTSAAQLASTGSDAAAVLPVAGVLALLGAIGVLIGRRRRPTGSAS
ncbi:LPXTG cell wall anchor domain-containing protein [Rathayibacter sp. VKM Ac-2856]|uniref:LPXTG cell wall anchor domain-containing protein n=1 Tax=unclassified Rathayibacter TaxID=2609250 RepID=UPI001562F3A1|nr:LPXTG cell wall anchor domain-containing protein [Rathayibacter sp. VKM Ac-2858]NQX18607.1 LPXTG cell wall anchor domain-containing protein [Rathayibacter sp. VKM Ac-2856]